MEEACRAELHARRTALLEEKRKQAFAADRAALVASVPILRALESAGEPYDSQDYRGLPRMLNAWAHDPDRWTIREDSCDALPDAPGRAEAMIIAALRARLAEDSQVIVVLRSEALVLTLPLFVLARHLPALLRTAMGDRLAFAAPPADWIITVWQSEAIPINEMVAGTLSDDDG